MKAIRVIESGTLKVVEKEEPFIKTKKEVKIRMKAMGICGSDMHILHGKNPFATYPRTLGHEIAGEVMEVGIEVSKVSVGDKVVIEPMYSCGNCYACKKGRPNVCANVEVYGVRRDGGGCEVMVMPEHLVHSVDSSLDWSEIALIEPFTIGAQAAYRGQVEAGDDVFIIGAGPIGLCCLKMVQLRGARVAIADFNEKRLAFAEKWGADFVINPKTTDVNQAIRDWTNGVGANVVIDAVGTEKTVEQAIENTSVASRVVLLGFLNTPSKISQEDIVKKELTIVGSRLQTYQFQKVIDLFNNQTINAKELVSHEFTIDKAVEAFQVMEEAPFDLLKVIIKF